MLFTFSRACGPPFDDPKGRWRRGGGTDQCPNYPKVFNKASRSIECKGTREADWHSCDPFKMTRDDNRLVTSTSTDSLNLHTEELREVPENLISSLFFHKNNASSFSSGALLKARGKIKLNVHEHLIIYFDFDLKRKKILLLHRCSLTSNILTLVHLLLSCSLLIVQDEFERIMYIVSKIFFIIIPHLLYAVACVAVSNLVVFLRKSNPSSCLAAIVS